MQLNLEKLTYAGLLILSGPASVLLFPNLALASDEQAAMPNLDDPIVVTARRPLFDVDPDRTWLPADIEDYGRDSIGDLLAEIRAETGESTDESVFFVNGKRVTGVNEVESLPAEAIKSLEVYAEGSAKIAGAGPTQRVYNIVLKPALDLATLRGEWALATEGSWASRQVAGTYSHIRDNRRFTLALKRTSDEILLESDRDIGFGYLYFDDPTSYRSLSPSRERWNLSLSAADAITSWLQGSIGTKLDASSGTALLGRAPGSDAGLKQRWRSHAMDSEVALNASQGQWLFSAFASSRAERRRTRTDYVASSGNVAIRDTESRSNVLNALLTASGPVLELPSGSMRLLLSGGIFREDIARTIRTPEMTKGRSPAQVSSTFSAGIEVPITSRSQGPFNYLGDIVVATELTKLFVNDSSGFTNWNVSVNWRLAKWLRFSGAFSENGGLPSVEQQYDPIIETSGYIYYDPLTSQSLAINRITGGIQDLPRRLTQSTRIGGYLKALKGRLQLTSEYVDTSVRNGIIELPAASAAVFAAFPDRFIRDSGGRLITVDARPIALSRRNQRQLRFGANLNISLGSAPNRGGVSPAQGHEPDATGSLSRNANAPPRLQLSAFYTHLLNSSLVINAGDQPIDMLSPQAIGLGRLGQSRHRLNVNLGYAEQGLGIRLTMQHQSRSLLQTTDAESGALKFLPLTTFDLRAWVQGHRLIPNSNFMKTMRFTISVQNLAGVREQVQDTFGSTPLAYQPAYRDPIGRTIALELRKTF